MFRRPFIGLRVVFGIFFAGSLFCGLSLRPTVFAQICSESQQRKVLFTAVNNEGQPIENLGKEDLVLKEDKADAEILTLEPKVVQPVSVAILIDTSVSQERVLSATKLIAQKFFESVLSDGGNRAALVSFSNEATVEQELTNDLEKLRAAIDGVKVTLPPGFVMGGILIQGPPPRNKVRMMGSTAIWDAVLATSENLWQAGSNVRRVVVLLTDGADTSSKMKLRDAIRQAATSDVKVFSIGIGDETVFSVDQGELRKLSEETGGLAFFPQKFGDLESVFNQIGKEIQSQYLLTYCTAEKKSDKSPRKVEIQFKDPVLRRSKARLSYRRYI